MTAEAYAQALWQLIERGMALKPAVAGLLEALETHGRTALLPKIARAISRIAMREARRTDVVLSVARTKDLKAAERAAKKILSEIGVGTRDIKTAVDEDLIGGWRLEGRERLVDASYKKSLLTIYESVIHS